MSVNGRTYTSVGPLTIEQLILRSDWFFDEENGEDGCIVDDRGNEAWFLEIEDGHLELHADDGEDISDLLEVAPFHLNEEDGDDDDNK